MIRNQVKYVLAYNIVLMNILVKKTSNTSAPSTHIPFKSFLDAANMTGKNYTKTSRIEHIDIIGQKFITESVFTYQVSDLDFVELDEVLNFVCPSITFLNYKRIMRKISEETYEENEGSSLVVKYKRYWISIQDLYKIINDFKH